jgi:hypothetical protein
MTPKRVHSLTNPSRATLLNFFAFAEARCERGGPVFTVFIPLMSVSPHRRLATNLGRMLDRMAVVQIRNVLEDGLSEDEQKALLELELHEASDTFLGVAHGLLNVHERWFLLKSVGSKFRAAADSSMEYVSPGDLLGGLLGGSDGDDSVPRDQEAGGDPG